ncbi:complement C1q tumor necrosis factor-related protein 2 isoform X2 [Periophthalmus magnuspinnatus]|nr:complement C1q tumor necrosis factor-related protein 2 isoform X2 [Periophthalmus magnuspinnatus]
MWGSMLFPVVFSQSSFPSSNSRGGVTLDSSPLVCGQSGPGATGPLGPPGEDGPDGRDGRRGTKGGRGKSGSPGNQGKPGVKGRKGAIGKTGPAGPGGPRGAPGQTGKRGAKGESGDEGEPGAPGGCNCGPSARSAFSVALTKSSPTEHRPIHFRHILLNEGNHYNASTGKFVCVIPGVYYFSYDVTVGQRHLALGLVHNDQFKTRTFDTNSGNYDVASGSVVVQLQRSDEVWLQVYNSGHNGLFFDPFWADSTFTGFLLYADHDYLTAAERKANKNST